MTVGFERIDPTPEYPLLAGQEVLVGSDWNSSCKSVKEFKNYLKPALRMSQRGRCCFCRRLLFDDYATHLEHYVDKDNYPQFTFEIRNLALACGTCNIRKNGHFSSIKAKRKRWSKRRGLPYTARCPVLVAEPTVGSLFPDDGESFRWVNPHADMFSSHIQLSKGWIYLGKTRKGVRTVRGVGLNDIERIEQRALSERLETRGGRLSLLVAAIAELDQHRAKDVAAVVVKLLARRGRIESTKS